MAANQQQNIYRIISLRSLERAVLRNANVQHNTPAGRMFYATMDYLHAYLRGGQAPGDRLAIIRVPSFALVLGFTNVPMLTAADRVGIKLFKNRRNSGAGTTAFPRRLHVRPWTGCSGLWAQTPRELPYPVVPALCARFLSERQQLQLCAWHSGIASSRGGLKIKHYF